MPPEIREEKKRGCGWRKESGLYLISSGLDRPCGLLPFPLEICPTFGQADVGKPARGWTWINPKEITRGLVCSTSNVCPAGGCDWTKHERAGLLWIGEKFYPTPQHFEREAWVQGVSKRVAHIPHGFELGSTWVLLAHRKVSLYLPTGYGPAIFRAFLPTRNREGGLPGRFRGRMPGATQGRDHPGGGEKDRGA